MPAPPHTPLERRVARKIARARGLAPNEPATIGHPLPAGGSTAYDKAWWGYVPLAQALIAIVNDPGGADEDAAPGG